MIAKPTSANREVSGPSKAAGKKSLAPARFAPGCDHCSELNAAKHPYRVFISYSHQDRELATRLEKHLRSEGLFPITDHEIRVGEAFSEEIREMIECSHVFMPLVTPSANERLWVQQEIGYAAALHVPVCPVAVGNLPSGMAEHIQGIHIAGDGQQRPDDDTVMDMVEQRLTFAMINDLVRRARGKARQGRYDCALFWNERQELLVSLTEAAYRGGCKLVRSREKGRQPDPGVWRLRQSTAFGSFSIPDDGIYSPRWFDRDPNRYRSPHDRRLLRRERQVMEAYTKCFGCDLILDPRINLKKGPETSAAEILDAIRPAAGGTGGSTGIETDGKSVFKYAASRTALRVSLLMSFLEEHIENDRVRVVIPAMPGQLYTNLIIVGDWFASEAVVPYYAGGGYERTMFTRHAPTVLNMIARFNQDFDDHLRGAGFEPHDSATAKTAKQSALDTLQQWYEELQTDS